LSFGRQVVKRSIKNHNNFDDIIISIEEYITTDEFKANLVEYQKYYKEKESEITKNYALQKNKIKIKDVLYHLIHGALEDRIVENMGYVYTLPQCGLNINDLLERENYSLRNLLDCLIITEKGKTYEECENKLKEKLSKNAFLIIGKNKKYLGLWPFGTKGMEVLVFIYKDEKRNANAAI
jgi:deoxyxylulose-5-phosphate synthase